MQVSVYGAELLFPGNTPNDFVLVKRVDDDLTEAGEWHCSADPFRRRRVARYKWCVSTHGMSVRATGCGSREWTPKALEVVVAQVCREVMPPSTGKMTPFM